MFYMKQNLVLVLLAVIVAIFSCTHIVSAQQITRNDIKRGEWKGKTVEYVEGEILIKMKKGIAVEAIKNELIRQNMQIAHDFNRLRWAKVRVPKGVDIFVQIEKLKDNSDIEAMEPNMTGGICTYPNDTYYADKYQWALLNTAQNPPDGTEDADIDMPEAWGGYYRQQ